MTIRTYDELLQPLLDTVFHTLNIVVNILEFPPELRLESAYHRTRFSLNTSLRKPERELSGEKQVLPFPRTRVPFPAFPSHLPRIPVPASEAARSSLYRSFRSHAQTHTHTFLYVIFKNFNIVKFKQNTPICT